MVSIRLGPFQKFRKRTCLSQRAGMSYPLLFQPCFRQHIFRIHISDHSQKARRGAPFKRHESVNLVREYIACMDEVTQLHSIYEQKLDFLSKLRKDCEVIQNSSGPDTFGDQNQASTTGNDCEPSKTMTEQVDWAVDQLKANHEGLPRTLTDLRNSLDDV